MSIKGRLKLGDNGAAVLEAKRMLDRFFPEGGTASKGPVFDFNTHLRVLAMQGKLNRAATGVLDEELIQAYGEFLRDTGRIVPTADAGDLQVTPASEEAAREAIYKRAQAEMDLWGFKTAPANTDSLGDRIVAGLRSEGKFRQGGVHLHTIYQVAGAHSGNCMVLTNAGLSAYTTGGPSKNAVDIGSWCGIFAIYCYRMAGINVSPWSVGGGLRTKGPDAEFRATTTPQKGDIGLIQDQVHHLIIEKVENGHVYSIDGNVDLAGLPSVISYKTRKIGEIHSFYAPIWERVLGS